MKVTFEIVTTGQLLFKFKLQGIHLKKDDDSEL